MRRVAGRVSRSFGRVLVALPVAAVLLLSLTLLGVWAAGWRLEVVLTDSMHPEIPEGALAVTAPVRPARIEVGDVVSYHDPRLGDRRIVHRVIEIVDQGEGRFFRLQGDANPRPDRYLVPAARLDNEVRWHAPRLGRPVRWLGDGANRWVLVAVPLALVAAGQARRLLRRPDPVPPTSCPHCGADLTPAPAPADPGGPPPPPPLPSSADAPRAGAHT